MMRLRQRHCFEIRMMNDEEKEEDNSSRCYCLASQIGTLEYLFYARLFFRRGSHFLKTISPPPESFVNALFLFLPF